MKRTYQINTDADLLTPKQLKYVVLYKRERNMSKVADICGVNKSTISRTIERAKCKPCRFSTDCNNCPHTICRIDEKLEAIEILKQSQLC